MFPWPGSPGASAVVLLALSLVTYRQIGYWKDEITIWSHASQVVKHHWLAEQNLGAELMQGRENGPGPGALPRATAIKPDDTKAIMAQPTVTKSSEIPEKPLCQYKQALQDYTLPDEDRVTVLMNMAVAYRDMGDAVSAQR